MPYSLIFYPAWRTWLWNTRICSDWATPVFYSVFYISSETHSFPLRAITYVSSLKWRFIWGYWMHQWMDCDADLLHEFSNAYSHTSNLTFLPCSVIDHVTLKLQGCNGTQNMHDAKIIEKDLLVGSRCFMNTWNIFRHVTFYLCTKITAVYERTKIPTRE